MAKVKILVCGILPPPNFGHSMIYKALMESRFVEEFDVVFFNIKFWSYEKHKKVTVRKFLQMIAYYVQFLGLVLSRRPRYILYAMSFDRMPFLKDFLFCMTGWALGCKIVIHDMGQYLRELYDASTPFFRGLVRFFMRRVTASIVLGEVTRRVYEEFLDLDRVIAVPGAVADSAPCSHGASARRGNGAVNVLYFSFLSRSKGIWTALKAIPKVVKTNSRVRFTIAGPVESENLLKEMNQFLDQEDLRSFVNYVGYVGDDDQRTGYFRDADIFIFPTHRDVFGLVLLHAMAESVAVVASREGAIPEIIVDGENGYLFPKGDELSLTEKILALADQPGIRQAMGQKNRAKYLELYTLDRYAERMIHAFKNVEAMGGPAVRTRASRRTPNPEPRPPQHRFNGLDIYFLIITSVYILWRIVIFLKRMP